MTEKNENQIQTNLINYKIVKCKNFSKYGSCRYGSKCLFAHGNLKLRTKEENLNQMDNNSIMTPNNINMGDILPMVQGTDMNLMQFMTPNNGNIEQKQFMINNIMVQQNQGMYNK